ncbi:MAG TPA: hypothetical protein VNT75_32675, partial [Symbiobacteriaceae bacterium]|nr:hypothetical protein [Symbiobacteriaceae bacterium]
DQTADEQRRVTLRCTAHGFAVILSAAEKVLDLSIDAGAGRPIMRTEKSRLRFTNPPPEGLLVSFTVPAGSPLSLTASAWYLTEPDAAPPFPSSASVVYQQAALVEISL